MVRHGKPPPRGTSPHAVTTHLSKRPVTLVACKRPRLVVHGPLVLPGGAATATAGRRPTGRTVDHQFRHPPRTTATTNGKGETRETQTDSTTTRGKGRRRNAEQGGGREVSGTRSTTHSRHCGGFRGRKTRPGRGPLARRVPVALSRPGDSAPPLPVCPRASGAGRTASTA